MAAFHLSGNVTVTHADISRMFEAIHKSLSTGYRTEELAQQLLRIFFCISEAAATKEGARLSLAERIHQYIDKNIGHGITSAKVAEHFQLSPIYAARVFKAHYLLTIAQSIQNSKLNLAAQLLRWEAAKAITSISVSSLMTTFWPALTFWMAAIWSRSRAACS